MTDMLKSPVFWIWIGSTAGAALADVAWARDQTLFGPIVIVGVNLVAMLMTAVFVGTAVLKGLRGETSELRTEK
jgi:hypothetical protein